MRPLSLLALAFALAGCTGPAKPADGDVDADGDGVPAPEDCDDGAARIHPGAPERCDGRDDDCDGDVDEDAIDAPLGYADADADGFGDPRVSRPLCTDAVGWVPTSDDCDDTDATVFPGAPERCDGVDDDCDALVDGEDDDVLGEVPWYADADDDGWGVESVTVLGCDAPPGYTDRLGDCDDTRATTSPGATETCDPDHVDENCDGEADGPDAAGQTAWYFDGDGDSWGDGAIATTACDAPAGDVDRDGDCDDADARIHPGAAETDCDDPVDYNCDGSVGYVDVDADGWAACTECDDGDAAVSPDEPESCDGIDDDCDGAIDEPDAVDAVPWYDDRDADGFGDPDAGILACDAPPGTVADATDCDDDAAAVHPGAAEVCDDAVTDEDCDGAADDADPSASGRVRWYHDADADGYGDEDDAGRTLCHAGSGDVTIRRDCDDADPDVNPHGIEICDAVDQDCDGAIDEAAVDAPSWYADLDGDGFGDALHATVACTAPPRSVADATDCDDLDADRWPGAPETCNRVDDDCDGVADDDAVDALVWYADSDLDGYGDATSAALACTAPSGTVADAADCNDDDAAVNPGATETCDGRDDDCDGTVDGTDAIDVVTWYADTDADGYGDAARTALGCDAPVGYVADATDCDDTTATVSPGSVERCDAANVDEDCDGDADDADSAPGGRTPWYRDGDADGYGDDTDLGMSRCDAPAGRVASTTDCDDADATINPAAVERCDSVDDDCDGLVDPDDAVDASAWYADADADTYGDGSVYRSACVAPAGYVGDATDCDDAAASRYPGAAEICDGADDDCDGTTDEASAVDAPTWYADADGDGYGATSPTAVACTAPAGYAATPADCDDTDAGVSPGLPELCDGADTDEDCDGLADDDDPSTSVASMATVYRDGDSDGYGAGTAVIACDPDPTLLATGGDCDDTDAAVHPGATEACADGVDQGCDGTDDCAWTGTSVVTGADLAIAGANANDYLGSAVIGGDLDGDGYADLVVSGYGYDRSSGAQNSGRVWIWYGPLGAEALATADATVTGASGGDRLGWSVADVGDTDGDGLDELLLGADGYNGTSATDSGGAWLFEASLSGAVAASDAVATLLGDTAYDFAGDDVAGGDFDGDGLADVLVGAYGGDTTAAGAGTAGLFLGPIGATTTLSAADTTFDGAAAGDAAGFALDAADLDGDGVTDVILGAYAADPGGLSSAGAVYVLSGFGAGSRSVSTSDATLTGDTAGDAFGYSLASAGDTDGDGLDDLVVGARAYDDGGMADAGAAWIFLGSATGAPSGSASTVDAARITGAAANDHAGEGVTRGGDIDGDGFTDLLLGAPAADDGAHTNAGALYLLYGPVSGSFGVGAADATWAGSAASDGAGAALAVLGDTDGDGYAELAAGVQGVDSGGHQSVGSVYVWFGTGE
jgi:hypothetical protein